MSTQLITARKKLNTVNTLLKQGKYMAAVHAVHDGLVLMLKSSLMKAEKDEFSELLASAVTSLNSDQDLRKLYPLIIRYNPGEERALLETFRELIEELQRVINEQAKEDMAKMEEMKKKGLEKGQKLLDAGEYDKAKKFFDRLVKEFHQDVDLKADIADRFLNKGRYQEAFEYLDDALHQDPNAMHLYNRIGIVLRKMQDYETAEKYYKKALSLAAKDEYLHFNIGRLYIDWGKWDKVEESALNALDLNKDFTEAEKMLKFARKRMNA